jgi:multimeric flavodoxin WrbA
MNVISIYGNPKDGGFVHGCLDVISQELEGRGASVERLLLKDAGVQDCVGCFTCLRTGKCPLPDGMDDICDRLRAADGFVVGCSVRNGTFTALYKRFWERITYPLGFTGDLSDKHVLSVSTVGLMGGRKATSSPGWRAVRGEAKTWFTATRTGAWGPVTGQSAMAAARSFAEASASALSLPTESRPSSSQRRTGVMGPSAQALKRRWRRCQPAASRRAPNSRTEIEAVSWDAAADGAAAAGVEGWGGTRKPAGIECET